MNSKRLLFFLLFSIFARFVNGSTVTNLNAQYHDGQIFIIWSNITTQDTGFYYVYSNTVPIDSTNIQTSTYLGRTRYDFGFDYRLSFSDPQAVNHYEIVNDNPLIFLDSTQNMFVMNCTKDKQKLYFAVRSNFGQLSQNWKIKIGSNASTIAVTQHLDPIKCYHYETINYTDQNNELMDVYVHYGGNVAEGTYPAMANEGCLVFHFGIIKSGPAGGMNYGFIKFHGGNGDFIRNALSAPLTNAWKISFDDWIPAFSVEASGDNTRWYGYDDQVNIYTVKKTSPGPTTGTVRAYTYYRTQWEYSWIQQAFPNSIDPNKVYLDGESQGCSGVLLFSVLSPKLFAAGNLTDGKYNLDAPNDDNPDCKYNDGNSGRKATNAYWGDHTVVNLPTDVPKKAGSSTCWKIYDLTNMNDVYNYNVNVALPFLTGINGKEDATVCWEEKVDFYNTDESTQHGGRFYYDLRNHNGGPENKWPPLKDRDMERFASNLSFPAFSNSSIDGDPGSDSNPNPPYWSGDSIGTLHGNLDWIDSSIDDEATSWQIKLFIHPDTLSDSTYIPVTMPSYATTNVTIRRAANFVNIPNNTVLCWTNIHNGNLIQSGTITQKYKGTTPKALTAKKVKIYPDGNVLRICYCVLPKTTDATPQKNENEDAIYPNPFNNNLAVNFYLNEESDATVTLYNVVGEKIQENAFLNLEAGKQEVFLNTSTLTKGIYFIKIKTSAGERSYKVVKE